MKTLFPAVIACLLVAATASAAPLTETTAIRSKPDAAAPVIGYLKAGTDPVSSADITAPAGWMAVDIPGPHEAYVHNNDFSKSLDIHAGAAIRLKPKADAPVLATMQEGDKTEIRPNNSAGEMVTGGSSKRPTMPISAAVFSFCLT